MCRVQSAPVRHNSHTNFHRQADEDRCRTVRTPLMCASRCIVSSRAATGNCRAAAAAPRKRSSCVWENSTVKQPLVRSLLFPTKRSIKAVKEPQRFKAPCAVRHNPPTRTVVALCQKDWTLLRLRVALVRTIQPWRPDRQTDGRMDGRTCVCSVETTFSVAGTCGWPAGRRCGAPNYNGK